MKKIAIIGHGMMGERHALSLRALGLEAYALMGRDLKRTEEAAKRLNIDRATVDFNDLKKMGIDVVHITTPPLDHATFAKEALGENMHVICEKPFTFDEKEGEELVRIAKEKNRVNAIGFNIRYHEAIVNAERIIASGEIGDVLLANGSYMQEFHALPAPYSWRADGKFLATSEIGSHYIDLVRYLTKKEIREVSATYASFMPSRVIKDGMQYEKGSAEGEEYLFNKDNAAIVTMKLEDNALSSVTLSEITSGRKNYLEITITGTKGSLWWNSEDLNHLKIAHKEEDIKERVFAFSNGFNESVTEMLKDVYEDIEGRDGERRYATFSDGLMNTRICNAIYNSAHNASKWEDV